MGKRELLIAVVFAVLGFAVYRVTAPPSDPSADGFSIGRVVDEIRREIRGQRANAEATFEATQPVAETITEIRLTFAIGAITIIGEDRDDIAAEMHVRSNGSDTAEAQRLAKESILTFDEAGALLIIAGKFPVEGRQTPTLKLRIPARLAVRMDEKGSSLEISNVASVMIGGGRGPSTIQHIKGNVTLTQRGSELTIDDVGSLKLSTISGVEARVMKVHGDATLNLQGGEFRGEEFGGGIQLESRNADVRFERIDKLEGAVRVEAMGGEIVFMGLRAETRIDARRAEIRIEHGGGAPLSIYSEGEETIELTVPPAGFTMDAIATNGDISLDEKLAEVGLERQTTGDGDNERGESRQETRLTGSVRGGGPAITLRANRGDIVVRAR